MIGPALELADKRGMTQRVNVQDVKITYLADKLIKCLPDDNFFLLMTLYLSFLKLMGDLQWLDNCSTMYAMFPLLKFGNSLTYMYDYITNIFYLIMWLW